MHDNNTNTQTHTVWKQWTVCNTSTSVGLHNPAIGECFTEQVQGHVTPRATAEQVGWAVTVWTRVAGAARVTSAILAELLHGFPQALFRQMPEYRLVQLRQLLSKKKKKTPWSESASELYRPSDRRFSAKFFQLVRIEGATWSAWRIPPAVFLGFLDRSRYFSIK
jgi:hypothetical protein